MFFKCLHESHIFVRVNRDMTFVMSRWVNRDMTLVMSRLTGITYCKKTLFSCLHTCVKVLVHNVLKCYDANTIFFWFEVCTNHIHVCPRKNNRLFLMYAQGNDLQGTPGLVQKRYPRGVFSCGGPEGTPLGDLQGDDLKGTFKVPMASHDGAWKVPSVGAP